MRKLLAVALMSAALVLPRLAFADVATDTGLSTTGGAANPTWLDTNQDNLPYFIGFYIVRPILGVVGLIFFVLMIYAGVLWMTAGGNGDTVKKAKGILVNSVIGAAIVVSAYAITSAIFYGLTSGSITSEAP